MKSQPRRKIEGCCIRTTLQLLKTSFPQPPRESMTQSPELFSLSTRETKRKTSPEFRVVLRHDAYFNFGWLEINGEHGRQTSDGNLKTTNIFSVCVEGT